MKPELETLFRDLLASNRGPGYGVSVLGATPDLSVIDVSLRFIAGRTYCCAEPGCHLPPDSGRSAIVHGDFRCDNMVFDPARPLVRAVLDWELSTLGDPASDFTYHLLMYRMPSDLFAGLAGADLAALNIPSEEDYVAAYCRRTGRDHLPNLDYLVVFNLFRLAAILHGIRGRIIRGTASSSHAVETAGKLETLAELAWAEARKARL